MFSWSFVIGMPHLKKLKLDDFKQKIIEALFQRLGISVEFVVVELFNLLSLKERNV